MATFTIDLLTGQPYVFNGDFSGSTISGTTYPQVAQYIDLPLPASAHSGEIYIVRQPYGTYMTGIKDAGVYWSNNLEWVRLGDITAYFNSDNFQVFDGADNTKGLKFITSGFTGGATRYATFKDKNGVVVYQEEIDFYTGTTAPNTFLRLNQSPAQKVFGGTPTFPSIQFDLTGNTTTAVGKLQWNPNDLTLDFGINADVTLQIGQEEIVRVVNKSGAPMYNGQLVIISGASGNKPAVSLANANDRNTAFRKILMLTQDIGDNNNGFATSAGLVNGLDTLSYSAGTRLYLSTTGGSWTDVPPPAPAYTVPVAVVTYQHKNNGAVLVFTGISPLPRLEDLSNVDGTPLTTTGQFPVWDNTRQYFDFTSNVNDFLTTSGATLQVVTEAGSVTNIESTFESGIITNRIKPTGDTTTALQIKNAGGTTAIINVDTVSGFTGFGTTTPKAMIHLYGKDISNDNPLGVQTNALRLDGLSATDREIQWAESSAVTWTFGTYRGENSRYAYLYNQEADTTLITASQGGRIGINNPSDILNYHAILVSGGTNDMKISGVYDKNFNSLFEIKIDSTGTTDTFVWRVSYDNGITYNAWSTPSGCTTGATLLESGVEISFENVNGHILNTFWEFPAFSQLPPATMAVFPNKFAEILLNYDYTLNIDNYIDVTGTLGTSDSRIHLDIFNTGNTNAAFYLGNLFKFNTAFFNLFSGGAGITLITEYWNGTSWVDVSIGNPFYLDETDNLSKSGQVIWNTTTMNDWIKAYLPNRVEEGYDLYWVRFRSASSPTVSPNLISVATNGDKRFSIYNSTYDYIPVFFVDALGRTSIGGGRITGNNVLQISKEICVLDVVGASPSLVEIDSTHADCVDLKIRLVSEDAYGGGIVLAKSRGTLTCSTDVQYDDKISHICSRATVGGIAHTLSQIETIYKGDGTTVYGDMIISTPNGSILTEKMRVSAVGTGFGGITPTATIHIQSGTTGNAPLKFTSGNLLSSPSVGAVEFSNDAWYGTITSGSSRKTFAFLESPQFTGNVNLPSTTCLNSVNLANIITYSGGTCNPLVVTHDEFNPYSATTQSIVNVVFSGATNGITNYNNHYVKLGGALTENTTISATTYSLNLKGYHIDLSDANDNLKFRINENSAVFTDNRTGTTTAGIEYGDNYSAGFLTHSLVDKAYVDAIAGGLTPKEAVNVATTGNIDLSSAPATIDGITLTNGMRILVKDQTSGATNGIYDYNGSGSAMTRSADFDGTPTGEVVQNAFVSVLTGSTNARTSWILSTPNPITVGSTVLTFVLYTQSLGVIAGNGIRITQSGGNNIVAVKLPANSGLLADGSGLYIDSSIAGNSLTWNSGVLNVNISGGTLNTALNSKLNTLAFNIYSGVTLNNINSRLLTSAFTGYSATTSANINNRLLTSVFNNYTGVTAPSTYVTIPVYSGYTAQTKSILASKAYLSGATFTGAIYAPTAVQNTNTCQVATTGYVVGQASTTTPLMDGTAAIGTSLTYARADHRHPSNTYGTSNGQILFNNNGTITGCTGFYMSGGTLYVPNVEVNGVGTYHYGDRITTLTTTSTTPVKYFGYTANTFTNGTYQIDINTRQGNLSNGKCTGVHYLMDGVIQSTFENAASFGGAQWSEIVTRDLVLTAGTHCFDIELYALGGGGSNACMARGVIRLRKIC